MTNKELRNKLFEIRNQKMTIEELRAMLFNLEQEKEFDVAQINEAEYWKNYFKNN